MISNLILFNICYFDFILLKKTSNIFEFNFKNVYILIHHCTILLRVNDPKCQNIRK